VTRITDLGPAAAPAVLNLPAPGGRFRRTVRFNLVTGTLATGVKVLAGARLVTGFQGREANALLAGAPERATVAPGGGGVTVSLPVARRIARVRLASAQPDDEVAAFRFDGPVVSEQAVATAPHGTNGARLDVTDRQLILRWLRGGVPQPLTVANVAALFVGYEAPNPRTGFDLPADGAGVEFLTVPPGGRGGAGEALGAVFAAALSSRILRFAEGREAPLPNPLAVDLVLEADHPCLGLISAFNLAYALTLTGFADSAEKQLLRFPGTRPAVERLEIRLPPNAALVSASLTLSEPGGPQPRQDAALASATAMPASGEGIMLTPGGLVAARVEPEGAQVVTGAEARLAAVETATAVVSLWEEDGQGLPGRKLTESGAVVLESGHPMTVPFLFSRPEALPAGPAWLVFSVEGGRAALALGDGGTGAVAIHSGTGFAKVAAVGAQGGAARLLYTSDLAEEIRPGTGLTVSLAGAAVALERDGERDGFRANLTSQLNAMPRPRPERIAIEIASQGKGVVTVDPPLFSYQEVA
jgi:hypothetical protein